MKSIDYIRFKIGRFEKGYVFTYSDFIPEVKSKETIIKVLNRMSLQGEISKLSKGRFYKNNQTVFGALMPNQYQVVKDLLKKNNKIIAYITGVNSYRHLLLTTQVSNVIEIGRNEFRPSIKRGIYKISFIKQKNIINKKNIPLLRILDAIKNIKKIPDSSLDFIANRLLIILKKLSDVEIKLMINLSLKYPASTRALLGALLEEIGNKELSILKQSLNPITIYKIFISKNVLSKKEKWNIK